MMKAASAFPLLLFAQLSPHFAQADFVIAGRVHYVDRYVWVFALVAYAAWIFKAGKLSSTVGHVLMATAFLAVCASTAARWIAMPLIWPLQLALVVALWQWWDRERPDWLKASFLLTALVAHAIGALAMYPACQLAVTAELLLLENAGYVCSVVTSSWIAAFVPAGLGAIAWAAVASIAVATRRA